MTYDWKKSASGEDTGPSMEPGYCRAKIVKVIRGKKDGTEFKSKNGDPQLMVIWENVAGESAPSMYTLSEKAGFVLAKMCERVGMDLDRMTEAGVTPESFADEEFAKKQLIGRECWVHVTTYGDNGKVNAEACKENDVPAQFLQQTYAGASTAGPHETLTEDDIPF